jgi:hypothetical protein
VLESLLMAQRFGVQKVGQLEDEIEAEAMAQPGAARNDLALRKMSRSPSGGSASLPLTNSRRTSMWLSHLVAYESRKAQVLAPALVQSPSTFSTGSGHSPTALPQLLWKWTNQGEHWNELHEIHMGNQERLDSEEKENVAPTEILPEPELSIQFEKPQSPIKVDTLPVSPKSDKPPFDFGTINGAYEDGSETVYKKDFGSNAL